MANCYWVEPGRLLAGEYPGITRVEPSGRIAQLLAAGITSFVDLTNEGELTPYNTDLGRGVVHRRFPITDHGVPASTATMDAIVDAIDKDLADGRRVYVHCRAGIGRTGTTVGCYLIHRGLSGPEALDKLRELWRRCSRARSWPTIPETEEQERYVREWVAPRARPAVDPTIRIEGAFVGLAIGEALGIATASRRLSDGAWMAESKLLDQLSTGSDTAMTIAVAESLLTLGRHDQRDQLTRYVEWSQRHGVQMSVPGELKRVLAMFQWSRKANPGSHDPANLDAHPVARTLSAAAFAQGDVFKAVELAVNVAGTTLQSPLVLDAVRVWAAVLVSALSGAAKSAVLSMGAAKDALQSRQVKPQIAALLNGHWAQTQPHDGAVSIVATALDVVRFTHSFENAVRESVRTSTSCAALVGALAGAHYGPSAIPIEWSRALFEADALSALARRFRT